MSPTPHNPEDDFRSLSKLVAAIVDAPGGSAIPAGMGWLNDRQTLATKLALHLNTIATISSGSLLRARGVEWRMVDHGSITVLARAVLENVIVFAFVFGHADMETCRFRHMTWEFSGLMDRQRRTATTDEARATLIDEKSRVSHLLAEIESHPLFAALSKSEKRFITKGDWSMGRQWRELAVQAGLSSRYFRLIYDYMCDYSHSGYAAAMQVGQATSSSDQEMLSRAMFGAMNLAVASFVDVYQTLFVEANVVLAGDVVGGAAYRRWLIPADRMESFYSGVAAPAS